MSAQRRHIGLWQGLVVVTVVLGVLSPCTYAEPGDEETGSPLRLTLTDCINRALGNNPWSKKSSGMWLCAAVRYSKPRLGTDPPRSLITRPGW